MKITDKGTPKKDIEVIPDVGQCWKCAGWNHIYMRINNTIGLRFFGVERITMEQYHLIYSIDLNDGEIKQHPTDITKDIILLDAEVVIHGEV